MFPYPNTFRNPCPGCAGLSDSFFQRHGLSVATRENAASVALQTRGSGLLMFYAANMHGSASVMPVAMPDKYPRQEWNFAAGHARRIWLALSARRALRVHECGGFYARFGRLSFRGAALAASPESMTPISGYGLKARELKLASRNDKTPSSAAQACERQCADRCSL
jgi:hypothetical protein